MLCFVWRHCCRHTRSCARIVLLRFYVPSAGFFALILGGLGGVAVSAQAATGASLDWAQATSRTLAQHPELQVYPAKFAAAEAAREAAKLRPPVQLGVDVENVAGSGDYHGLNQREITLALSSVLELGDQRESRVRLANARYGLIDAEQQAQALDLLGDLARRFIAGLALQEKLELVTAQRVQAERTLTRVKARVASGAAAELELLQAQVQFARTAQEVRQWERQLLSQRWVIASFWGDEAPDFTRLIGDLTSSVTTSEAITDEALSHEFEALYARVRQAPMLNVFAATERLRRAQVDTALSRNKANVEWQIGARHFAATDEAALTFGVAIPLSPRTRNRYAVEQAQAQVAVASAAETAKAHALRAQLFEAWQTCQSASEQVQLLHRDLIPRYQTIARQLREGYERGRYSYMELERAERDLLAMRLTAIDAAAEARLQQVFIEQLTGEPLVRHAASVEGK